MALWNFFVYKHAIRKTFLYSTEIIFYFMYCWRVHRNNIFLFGLMMHCRYIHGHSLHTKKLWHPWVLFKGNNYKLNNSSYLHVLLEFICGVNPKAAVLLFGLLRNPCFLFISLAKNCFMLHSVSITNHMTSQYSQFGYSWLTFVIVHKMLHHDCHCLTCI